MTLCYSKFGKKYSIVLFKLFIFTYCLLLTESALAQPTSAQLCGIVDYGPYIESVTSIPYSTSQDYVPIKINLKAQLLDREFIYPNSHVDLKLIYYWHGLRTSNITKSLKVLSLNEEVTTTDDLSENKEITTSSKKIELLRGVTELPSEYFSEKNNILSVTLLIPKTVIEEIKNKKKRIPLGEIVLTPTDEKDKNNSPSNEDMVLIRPYPCEDNKVKKLAYKFNGKTIYKDCYILNGKNICEDSKSYCYIFNPKTGMATCDLTWMWPCEGKKNFNYKMMEVSKKSCL